MFSYRQGKFVFKNSKPSLFLLIHGQNNNPAWSVEIALESAKILYIVWPSVLILNNLKMHKI